MNNPTSPFDREIHAEMARWRSRIEFPAGNRTEAESPERMTHTQAMLFARDLNRTYEAMKKAHRDLNQSYMDTLESLILASEFKDGDTGSHIKRIGRFSTLITEKLDLSRSVVEQIGLASAMHDIGKIGIPDHILLKKGRLSHSEFAVMKTHTLIGARILAGSHSEILRMAHNIALSHHEWWNGEGYPCGLKGMEIPLEGRIVALADFFDACTSKRPYRDALPFASVIEMIRDLSGRQFESRLVKLLLDNQEEIKQLMKENGQSKL